MPMKGLMMTSSFMKAILNKEEGLIKEGCILSQATVLEYTEKNRALIAKQRKRTLHKDED